jgi:hypothetical protein
MSVCVYSVCVVVLCISSGLADPPSKESYRLHIGLRNLKSGQGPKRGCSVRERKIMSRFGRNKETGNKTAVLRTTLFLYVTGG